MNVRLPRSNTGALLGAGGIVLAVSALQTLVAFLAGGAPFPVSGEGWFRLFAPGVAGGLLALLTPYYSLTEQQTGRREVTTPPDAPVATLPPPPPGPPLPPEPRGWPKPHG